MLSKCLFMGVVYVCAYVFVCLFDVVSVLIGAVDQGLIIFVFMLKLGVWFCLCVWEYSSFCL